MLWLIPFALLTGRASEEGRVRSDWDGVRSQLLAQRKCEGAGTCVALDLHLLSSKGSPPVDARWWQLQMEFARRVFAPVKVDFELRSVQPLQAEHADIVTRQDRDDLLPQATSRDGVDVFVVNSLADVDVKGAFIRGVHWRRRDQTSKRWIIVSRISMPGVLAHELGHFFGLPHSSYRDSLMNKRPGKGRPPFAQLVFVKKELKRVAEHRDKMLRAGRLRGNGEF